MSVNVHIEHWQDTAANINSNADQLQAGVCSTETFTTSREWTHIVNVTPSSDERVYYSMAGRYYERTGAAWTYLETRCDTLTLDSDLNLGQYMYHTGDTDTFIRYQTDQIDVEAGGVSFLQIVEDGSQDIFEVNQGEVDVDFTVNTSGNSDSLFVQGSSGYVGVGTSSPGYALDVLTGNITSSGVHFGEVAQEGLFFTSQSASQAILSAGYELVSGTWTARFANVSGINMTNGNISFIANNGETPDSSMTPASRVYITNAGLVGVGTVTPGNMLDIVTGATTDSAMHIGEAIDEGGYFTSTSASELHIGAGVEAVSDDWTARHATPSKIGMGSGTITFTTDTGQTPGSTFTPTERMRIDDSGQVGIGTNTPGNKLDIVTGATTDSGFHFGEAINEGAYFYSPDSGYLDIAAGAEAVSGSYVARNANPTIISMAGAAINFFADSGETPGAGYSPTQLVRFGVTGTTFGYDSAAAALVQVMDADANTAVYIDTYHNGSTNYPELQLRKSNTGSMGGQASGADGHTLGMVKWMGPDTGNAWDLGASITVTQRGSVGAKVPSSMVLETNSSSALNTNQLYLTEGGDVGIGVATTGIAKLEVLAQGTQLRLTETAATRYWDIAVDSSGHLNIDGTTGDVKIGDTSGNHYTQIDGVTGEITLIGNARVKKEHIFTNANLGKGGTAPTQNILGDFTIWNFTKGDDVVIDWQLPPDLDPSGDISVKLCWEVDEAYAANNGEVRWTGTWSACPEDASEALDSPTHSGSLDSGDINIPATAKYLIESHVGTISNASIEEDDAIGITLTRDNLVGGTDVVAEPGVIHLELEYTSNRLGETL